MLIPISSAALRENTQVENLFDTHPEVSLNFKHIQEQLLNGYDKPFLLVDSSIIRHKARRFKAALPRVHPHYAVKANPDRRVLETMIEENVKFNALLDSINKNLVEVKSIKDLKNLY